jgi:hypothetical protein
MADTTPHVKVFFDDNGTVTEVSTASPLPTTGGGPGGGGTGGTADVQYVDGVGVPTHPTGTAIVIASGGAMVDVAVDNPLPVSATDLPPGAATDSTLSTLAASAAAEFALFQAGTALVNQARLTIVDDTTRTVPGQAGTATLASVAASATSVTLAAASVAVLGSSAGRMGLVVVNDSASGTLYLAYKATAAITGASAYTYKIAPGETWTMPAPLYNGAISGIWDVASGAARITALSA